MKKGLLGFALCALLSFGVASTSYAQPSNCLAIDPLALVQNNLLEAQYEFSLDEASSLAIRGEFITKGSYTHDYSAVGFGGEWRFYVTSDHAVKGLNVGPAADIYFFNNTTFNKSSTILAIGGDAAYKFLFGGLAIEPQVSLRIGMLGDEIPNYKTTYFYGSIYFGYAW